MESVLVSLISMALIVVSTLAVTLSTFKSANKMADAWRVMEERVNTLGRTEISVLGPTDYHGGNISLTVVNEGHVNVLDFARWDVILQYQSGDSSYLTRTSANPPGVGQWAVAGIFVMDGSPEVFDAGILNPGEYMVLSVAPGLDIQDGEMARLVVSTPNGVTAQCYVTNK